MKSATITSSRTLSQANNFSRHCWDGTLRLTSVTYALCWTSLAWARQQAAAETHWEQGSKPPRQPARQLDCALPVYEGNGFRYHVCDGRSDPRRLQTDGGESAPSQTNRTIPRRAAQMCSVSVGGHRKKKHFESSSGQRLGRRTGDLRSTQNWRMPCPLRHWSGSQGTQSFSATEAEAKACTKGCVEGTYADNLS